MYQAMASLGMAAESDYRGPIKLEGETRGASVLVLGAGLAGMVAALELQNAGYRVRVLEAQNRAGGRCLTLRGGDEIAELGGVNQRCAFDDGLYFNAGAWRIPYHHHAVLDYCRRLRVPLEPFVQVNHNAYLHAEKAFGGKPQRFRAVQADFQGHVAELLAKAGAGGRLDRAVSVADKVALLESLRTWGALDKNYRYRKSSLTSGRRGYERPPGGGLAGAPEFSDPLAPEDLLRSGIWHGLAVGLLHNFQGTLFQPVGGMDMIARAFETTLGDIIQFGAKVTAVRQTPTGVSVSYRDRASEVQEVAADWCVCTIPLTILRNIDIAVSSGTRNAIKAVEYAPAVKVGLQFARRFWEEDEAIYGGISFTDLPIGQIAYPSSGYLGTGKGVLLGAYVSGADSAFAVLPADEQVKRAVLYGSRIHPQYRDTFEAGVTMAWHRAPWARGCYTLWSEDTRQRHYKALCEIDGRIVLAGEHASYLSGWQEGAILSSLDAIQRLHRRVVAG